MVYKKRKANYDLGEMSYIFTHTKKSILINKNSSAASANPKKYHIPSKKYRLTVKNIKDPLLLF